MTPIMGAYRGHEATGERSLPPPGAGIGAGPKQLRLAGAAAKHLDGAQLIVQRYQVRSPSDGDRSVRFA